MLEAFRKFPLLSLSDSLSRALFVFSFSFGDALVDFYRCRVCVLFLPESNLIIIINNLATVVHLCDIHNVHTYSPQNRVETHRSMFNRAACAPPRNDSIRNSYAKCSAQINKFNILYACIDRCSFDRVVRFRVTFVSSHVVQSSSPSHHHRLI